MTNSDFKSFTEKLKYRLHQPLPGKDAQIKMAPRPIDERRFAENPAKPPRLGGVMVLLYPQENEIFIPLMKRPEYDGAHSGQISFPGGKLEDSDKDLVDTALRETHEEIGIGREQIEVIGNLSELFIIASNFKVLPTVGLLKEPPRFIPDPIEVADVLTMPLNYLHDRSIRKVKEMYFPPYTIFSPYFEVSGEIVWGATAMMLSELSAILDDVKASLR